MLETPAAAVESDMKDADGGPSGRAAEPLRGFVKVMSSAMKPDKVTRDDFTRVSNIINATVTSPAAVLKSIEIANKERKTEGRMILASFLALPQGARLNDLADIFASESMKTRELIADFEKVMVECNARVSTLQESHGVDLDIEGVVDDCMKLASLFCKSRTMQAKSHAADAACCRSAKEAELALDGFVAALLNEHAQRECIPWLLEQAGRDLQSPPGFSVHRMRDLPNVLGHPLPTLQTVLDFYESSAAMSRTLQKLKAEAVDAENMELNKLRALSTETCAAFTKYKGLRASLSSSLDVVGKSAASQGVMKRVHEAVEHFFEVAWLKIAEKPRVLLKTGAVFACKGDLTALGSAFNAEEVKSAQHAVEDATFIGTGLQDAAKKQMFCVAGEFVKHYLGMLTDFMVTNSLPEASRGVAWGKLAKCILEAVCICVENGDVKSFMTSGGIDLPERLWRRELTQYYVLHTYLHTPISIRQVTRNLETINSILGGCVSSRSTPFSSKIAMLMKIHRRSSKTRWHSW